MIKLKVSSQGPATNAAKNMKAALKITSFTNIRKPSKATSTFYWSPFANFPKKYRKTL